jgi:poly-beta-hydroxybutyrate-responsive repressor
MSLDKVRPQVLDVPVPPDDSHARVGRNATPFVLLVLLDGRSYGYEIRSRLEGYGFHKSASEGVLYRLLRGLEDQGLIASEWDTAGNGPARRYYGLTPAGRERLAQSAEQLRRQARRLEQFFELFYQHEPAPPDRTA